MNNWIVGTVLAATVIGGGGAIYMIAVPPPVPAVPAKAGSEVSKAAPAQTSGSPAKGTASEKTADSARPGPATSLPQSAPSIVALGSAPAAMLKFRVEVDRTDQPRLNTSWTAVCPRLAMAGIDGCRATNEPRKAGETPSGFVLVDDGDGMIGFIWNPGVRLSPEVNESLPPGTKYPVSGSGGPKVRWVIPVDDWKKGVTFQLGVSQLKVVGTTFKRTHEEVGKARITLID